MKSSKRFSKQKSCDWAFKMNVKILRTQSLLQEALQEVLFDLEDTRLKSIAITRVECSKGKEVAKVFLDKNSLGDLSANDALKLLKKASGAIRANLQAQLSWYRTPNLNFVIDESLENINRLEGIFRKIHAKEHLNESSLRDSQRESKQSTINLVARSATKSRPLRGAKNREQGCSSATADFLLEAEKRGSPPKSEKRQLLARRGSGAGGAALLRKDLSESNGQNGESNANSTLQNCDSYNLDSRGLDCFDFDKSKSRNDKKVAQTNTNPKRENLND
ncbi:30S ribosome-binding factor RbfA [Helicobacter sp. 23-1044]